MSDYDALLRGVLADPASDLPRLVLADYLEENGQGDRAEFVRLSCEVASAPACLTPSAGSGGKPCRECRPRRKKDCLPWCESCSRRGDAETRSLALLRTHQPAWTPPRVAACVWSRGLAHEVRLTLAQFVGGPCVGCDVGPGVRRYATHGGDWTEGECNECRGTGRVVGCAEAMFREHPVTRVVLADREPMLGVRGRDAGGSPVEAFAWVVEGVVTGPSTGVWPENTVPAALADVLPGGTGVVGRDFVYPTRQAALDALFNVAAVQYGRRLAGLDPIPAPKE